MKQLREMDKYIKKMIEIQSTAHAKIVQMVGIPASLLGCENKKHPANEVRATDDVRG